MSNPLVRGNNDLITEYWTGKAKKEKKETPVELFKKYCQDEPWMPECKKYDV
jgi:hypothetical protein